MLSNQEERKQIKSKTETRGALLLFQTEKKEKWLLQINIVAEKYAQPNELKDISLLKKKKSKMYTLRL